MKSYRIPRTDLDVSRIAYGCMNLGGSWGDSPLTREDHVRATTLVDTALEQGINFFDHADIYTRGKSELLFGQLLADRPGLRERIVLQSKVGIRFANDPVPGVVQRFDFSYEHIVRGVEGILRRLQTDYLDILLLHRPDPLVEPEEVARAFDELERSGKVRYFGVSNQMPAQIELLKRSVAQPLVVNQLELNLLHSHLISEGIDVNREGIQYTASAGLLDYCRLHDIFVQAWSPVAGGALFNPPADAPAHVRATAELVATLATEKETTREAIVLAWLLRHPAGIQPIIGTTTPERLVASARADEVALSREEWYALFVAGRGAPVP